MNSSAKEFSILIVDDEVDLAESLKDLFEIQGCKVKTAYRADSAMSILKDEKFDFVLSDIRMPNISGLGLATAIRDMRLTQASVYLMTAHGAVGPAVYEPLGVKRIFDKPFNMMDVYQVFKLEHEAKTA